jgi:nucleoside-diphosphate-sugar epimerase
MMRHSNTVFVTGGSTFVGRNIVEVLQQQDYKVRALVPAHRQQVFDHSIEVVAGDLSKPETYASALRGVSAVVHAALTEDLSNEPQASSDLLNFSGQAGVGKFIHLSSIAIYGTPASGTITEETPPLRSADAYSLTKLASEEALLSRPSPPEVVILRLGCVYGPGGGWWTEGLLSQMKRGNVILLNDGSGIANLIHITDIAGLTLMLLRQSNPPLGVFNVTDGMPVTWSQYFSELERLLGRTAIVRMNMQVARDHARKWLRPSLLRRVLRRVAGARPIHPLDDRAIETFASQAVYSNEKAATMLTFRPTHDLESGMRTIRSAASMVQAPLLQQN